MSKAIRTDNFRARVGMVLLAGLLLLVTLVFVLQPAVTTSDREDDPAVQAISAGGSDFQDPYIDRHAEVVARYHEGGLR
jgi:ABC-type phosphate transport system substrate-binding protein